MLKLISKVLLPIAMIFAALFGASWAEGCPQYWYIVGIVILFLMSCAIDYIIDKLRILFLLRKKYPLFSDWVLDKTVNWQQ